MLHRPVRYCSFTLIELLVVVSIIALLIAILMPSLASARRQARQSVCLGQLSQLGVALQLYADQFTGFLPPVYGGCVAWGEEHGALYQLVVVSNVLPKTTEIPKVLTCPDARPRGSISYALNAVLFGYRYKYGVDTPGSDVGSLKLSSPRTPSKVVALYDVRPASLARVWGEELGDDEADISDQFTATGMLGTARPNPAGFMWQQSLDDPPIRAETPHGPSHNVLFADTHAAAFTNWQPTEMTRLTGRQPNDSRLH